MAFSLSLRFPPSVNPKPMLSPNGRSHLPSRSFTPNLPSRLRAQPMSLLSLGRGAPTFAVVRAANKDGDSIPDKEEVEARGESTFPERFRYLTKEVPEKPVRWPWLIAVVFLVYAWRTVLWELSNWKKTIFSLLNFVGYLGKLILAVIFHFLGDPITAFIQSIEFALNFARSIYSSIITSTPVPELSTIILLTSAVLAIAKSASPNSVNEQPYILSAAGLVGFGIIQGFVPDILFLLSLVYFFCYSRFIRKRDAVSAALPSAALMVAVGEPWIRALVMAGYLALAIVQHSGSPTTHLEKNDAPQSSEKIPVPLFLAALSIGIHLAAKWLRYRHLTWMIV